MTSFEGMARIAELLLQNGANVGKHSNCFFEEMMLIWGGYQ